MFPTVRCSFTNLRPDQKYWVLIDIVPCDNKRYRYAYHRSSWLVAGKADPPPPHRLYAHPDADDDDFILCQVCYKINVRRSVICMKCVSRLVAMKNTI